MFLEKSHCPAGSLAEILVEAEVAYGNLIQRAITLEHSAVIREDASLLAEAESGFIRSFVDWAKKWLAKLKEFFAGLWRQVLALFMADEKWFANYKGSLQSVEFPADRNYTVKTYPNVAGGKVSASISQLMTIGSMPLAEKAIKNGDSDAVKKELIKVISGGKEGDSYHEAVVLRAFGAAESDDEEINQARYSAVLVDFPELITMGKKISTAGKLFAEMERMITTAASGAATMPLKPEVPEKAPVAPSPTAKKKPGTLESALFLTEAEGAGPDKQRIAAAGRVFISGISLTLQAITSSLRAARGHYITILRKGLAAGKKQKIDTKYEEK